MAISDEITRLQNAKAALKTAINSKNDSSHQIDDETLEDYAGFVDNISTGSSATLVTKTITENGTYDAEDDSADGYSEVTVNVQPPQEAISKDVNFYDYDGKILYSYTASEFAQLTALPANPTHTGLTSQGWNWSLADAKAQVTAIGACDIGQMYVTNDGKTRLYCNFTDETKSFYLSLCPNGTLVIDWGDGSSTDTVTGSSRTTVVSTQHTYASGGKYTITIEVSSGNFAFYGSSNQSYLLRKAANNTQYIHLANLSCLNKVEVGTSCYLNNYCFNCCYNLKTITLPSSLPDFGTFCFQYCVSLKHITIPTKDSSPITTLGNQLFRYAYGLSSISIPKCITTIGADTFRAVYLLHRVVISNGITTLNSTNAFYTCFGLREAYISTAVTSIKGSTFYQCYSLSKLVIPASVTTIATKAFSGCYGMKEYHFKSTTVPTLDNTDAFANMQSDCVIYVPSAKLNDYKTASNWSTYAGQMVGE